MTLRCQLKAETAASAQLAATLVALVVAMERALAVEPMALDAARPCWTRPEVVVVLEEGFRFAATEGEWVAAEEANEAVETKEVAARAAREVARAAKEVA